MFFSGLVLRIKIKKRWTSLTDYVDFCSVLHGLQIAEYSLMLLLLWIVREIEIYELCTLADYFNVSTDYILGRTENKATPDTTSAFESLLVENYSSLKELRNLNLDEKAIVTSIIANCVNLINLKNK